jgi:hypothetical protein
MPGNPKVHRDVALLNELDEEMIFLMFEEGKSISDICIGMGVSKRALDIWIEDNDYSAKITRARTLAADKFACELVTIADSVDDANQGKAGYQIKTRQWLAERWDRKTYGTDKAQAVNISIQGLRMEALRHVEVVEQLSTDAMPKLSTE